MTFEKPTLRSTWLPLGLAVLALILLNLGLYGRLSSQVLPPPQTVDFPYSEDFSEIVDVPYLEFGGDWEIRDQTLVQLDTNGYDLSTFIPIAIAPEQAYQFESDVRFIGGSAGGGLYFNAQQSTSRQKSHMVRFNVDQEQLWLIYGYFGDDSDFVGQGSVLLSIAPGNNQTQRLMVQVEGDTYAVILNGSVQANEIPLFYRGGAVGLVAAASQVAFDNVGVGPLQETVGLAASPVPAITPSVTVQTSPVTLSSLFSDGFDGAMSGDETLWRPISGQWLFEDGVYAQTQTAGFDLSSIYQQAFAAPYTLRVTFRHRANVGGGVLFGLPNLDNVRGGHMVRYVDDGSNITWGYFDNNGAYVGQGSVQVSLPGETAHTLEVRVDANSYTVRLDDIQLAAGLERYDPTPTSSIGLTASQSAVAFDLVELLGEVDESAPTTSAMTEIDTGTATGDWMREDTRIIQRAIELTDFIAGTGIAGEQFTISADILLPDNNLDSGAGVIFHMSERDQRALGSMVRFSNGGRELFWGHYDAAGVFIGEGSVTLELSSGTSHTLQLLVSAGSYTIVVDDNTVVSDIPLSTTSGWIGLLSFSGPVTFSNIQLALGE